MEPSYPSQADVRSLASGYASVIRKKKTERKALKSHDKFWMNTKKKTEREKRKIKTIFVLWTNTKKALFEAKTEFQKKTRKIHRS